MNKVPSLRFKEFSGEWEEKKFKDLVLLQRGSSPRPIVKYITTSVNGVNWIKIGDTNKENRFITHTSEKITKEGAKKSREVKKGEIILSNSMSYGRPFILKIDGYIHDGWFVLRNYEKNLNKEFLCQLLGSEIVQKQYKKLASGGVVENISSELVNAVIINLPNLEEQEKIGNFLSSVDKKISIVEEKLNLFNQYKKGIMQKIFNQELRFKDENGNNYPQWEERKLKKIYEYFNGSSFENYVSENGKYNLITLNSIDINANLKKEHKTVNIDKNLLYKNDLIMVLSDVAHGNFLGLTAIIPENNKFVLNQRMAGLRAITETNVKYIRYYINSNQFYFKLHGQGSSQLNLSKKDVEEFIVKLPCLEEQKKIADFLSAIDDKIENISGNLESLKLFKKSMLQKMFV